MWERPWLEEHCQPAGRPVRRRTGACGFAGAAWCLAPPPCRAHATRHPPSALWVPHSCRLRRPAAVSYEDPPFVLKAKGAQCGMPRGGCMQEVQVVRQLRAGESTSRGGRQTQNTENEVGVGAGCTGEVTATEAGKEGGWGAGWDRVARALLPVQGRWLPAQHHACAAGVSPTAAGRLPQQQRRSALPCTPAGRRAAARGCGCLWSK